MDVAYLIGSSQPGTQRSKRITALALIPGAASLDLEFPLGHIIVQHIARYIIQRFRFIDIARPPADHHRQLDLPVSLHRSPRDDNIVVRPAKRGSGLQKDEWFWRRRSARLPGMIHVIKSDTHDLGRPRDR